MKNWLLAFPQRHQGDYYSLIIMLDLWHYHTKHVNIFLCALFQENAVSNATRSGGGGTGIRRGTSRVNGTDTIQDWRGERETGGRAEVRSLIYCGLVMPYGDIEPPATNLCLSVVTSQILMLACWIESKYLVTMALYKIAVTPLLIYWGYCHHYVVWISLGNRKQILNLMTVEIFQ